jgi:uncharacterized protein (TIGR03067 family)
MKTLLTLLSCFAVSALAVSDRLNGQPPKSAASKHETDVGKKELASLAGRWRRVEFNAVGVGWRAAEYLLHGGKKRTLGINKPYPLEIKGNTFMFAGTAAGKAVVKIDPTKSSKTIDLTDAQGRIWLGIYELKEDELIINLGLGKKRPATIKRSGTFGQANIVYKRAKNTPREEDDSKPSPRAKKESGAVIGKVLGEKVSRKDLRKEFPVRDELARLFLKPVLEQYRSAHRKELELTEKEIARALRYHQERAREKGPGTKPLGRAYVKVFYSHLKFQQHLYRTYGGGRILFQQFGPEAFDAMYRWLREREKAGDFRIDDPGLNKTFYEYWTTKQHGAFLSTPKDKQNPLPLRFPWERQ